MNKAFETSQIKNLKLKNKVGVAPMVIGKSRDKDGIASDYHLNHYTLLAKNQVGFITQGATAVNSDGYLTDDCLGIFNEQQKEALKMIVEGVHQEDCKIGIQLNHAGAKARGSKATVYAPSKLAENQIALTKETINAILNDFEKSASYAQEVGYDYIEIHGAHGYLINQFLSPLKNFRDDEYGKDRGLFLKQVYEACRRGFNGVIGVRISAEEYDDKGNHIEYYMELCKTMQAWGVDYISVSTGGVAGFASEEYPCYQVKYASMIKKEVTIPIQCAGLITKEEEIEQILRDNEADYVLMAREFLKNPSFMSNWIKCLEIEKQK